jgi:hypothetical protein
MLRYTGTLRLGNRLFEIANETPSAGALLCGGETSLSGWGL